MWRFVMAIRASVDEHLHKTRDMRSEIGDLYVFDITDGIACYREGCWGFELMGAQSILRFS